jgi:hypothetical protein
MSATGSTSAGKGWQSPECDGATAATSTDDEQILALNIAVSGTAGSAANAFIHDPASTNGYGKYQPSGWTAIIADGKDNYIGSVEAGRRVHDGLREQHRQWSALLDRPQLRLGLGPSEMHQPAARLRLLGHPRQRPLAGGGQADGAELTDTERQLPTSCS